MKLSDLGFDLWFQQKRDALKRPELDEARVTRVDRERYLVRTEVKEVQAEVTGKLLFASASSQDLPCVGDWVLVQHYNDGELAIIHEVLPRRSFLRRKSAGKTTDYQMIASNIDVAFIIQSCDADFSLRRMERYIVISTDGRIEPVILLSKTDLVSADELARKLSLIGEAHISPRVIPFSNTTSVGLDSIQLMLQKRKTYCLLGSSGVGKTTLLNHLLGRDEFDTSPVRNKDGKGRHTTARRHLTVLENGAMLIDTPGMRELGIMGVNATIDESFPEIHSRSECCRFNDCTHTTEVGCAILAAIERGELSEERYHSYIKLRKESAFHEMSYVERRKKDKKFGRMVKTVMKQLKKDNRS